MESHNSLIDTTHNPPPLTYAQHVLKKLFNFYFGFTMTGSFWYTGKGYLCNSGHYNHLLYQWFGPWYMYWHWFFHGRCTVAPVLSVSLTCQFYFPMAQLQYWMELFSFVVAMIPTVLPRISALYSMVKILLNIVITSGSSYVQFVLLMQNPTVPVIISWCTVNSKWIFFEDLIHTFHLQDTSYNELSW